MIAMNKELLRKISSVLKGEASMKESAPQIDRPLFSMGVFFDPEHRECACDEKPCGTAMCIAGWACALSGVTAARMEEDTAGDHVFCKAQLLLGLTDNAASNLFYAWTANKALVGITEKEAAAVIDNLIITGDVDWESFT